MTTHTTVSKANAIGFQLGFYNERNARKIQSLNIIPNDYYKTGKIENQIGDFGFHEDILRFPEVLIYFNVPENKETGFMSLIVNIADELYPDLGGFSLVKYGKSLRFPGKTTIITLVDPIPASSLEEHIKWCDLSCWQEYQSKFTDVQAHPIAIKLTCPKCCINGSPVYYRHWYVDPDPNNEYTKHNCPKCCTIGIK